jgi:two-component system response regulator AtoC
VGESSEELNMDAKDHLACELSDSAPTSFVHASEAMHRVQQLVEKAARSTATVLIRGESGTGKEVAARTIHELGPRRGMPFLKIQCSALPDALLESELFGYEKGAFTGAVTRKPGRVELAQGGTLFLDEIGDITPAMQVKLLRVLQDRQFERLGGTETVHVDVRIIAATHRDLDGMMKREEFRADLFYRLAVVPLWLPPLRTRRDDIEPLARHFCKLFAEVNRRAELHFEEGALRLLRRERWPGNVRELQNFVERLVVLAEGPSIGVDDVIREQSPHPTFATQPTSTAGVKPLVGVLERERRDAERRSLASALKETGGNRTLAARVLGVSRRTLYNMLDEHDVT